MASHLEYVYQIRWIVETSDSNISDEKAIEIYEQQMAEKKDTIDRLIQKRKIGDERKGVDSCPKCHSTNTRTTQIQTRSSDEPMTVYIDCYACRKMSRQ